MGVESIVRGDRPVWMLIAALWLITTAFVFAQTQNPHPTRTRILSLLFVTAVASGAGLFVSAALAVPRIRWSTLPNAEIVAPRGETWRRLRGPSLQVSTADGPDIAVPTIDGEGRWVLFGLLSGRALDGAPPAPETPPKAGRPRLCHVELDTCRAWPAAWPDPAQAPQYSELTWSKTGAFTALAYDVEASMYLQSAEALPGSDDALELLGRVTNDPSRETLSSLFIVRRIAGGRLRAMRVVSMPAGGSYIYYLQRADIALAPGHFVLRFVAWPLLFATALGLPLAMVAYLVAPMWLAGWLRRRDAVRRELGRPLVLAPIFQEGAAAAGVTTLAAIVEDADLGDARVPRGEVVTVMFDVHRDDPITSRAWFELPAGSPRGERPGEALAEAGSAVPHGEQGAPRKVGVLVPADRAPFRRAAEAWVSRMLHPVATCAAGVVVGAPGLVALASMLAAR